MSLILDALKKSDAERSRRRAPEAAAGLTPVADRGSRRWGIPVAILLIINAIGIGWLVGRSMNETTPVVNSQPNPVDTTAGVPAADTVRPTPLREYPARNTRIERLSDQTVSAERSESASEPTRAVEPIEVNNTPVADAPPVIVETEQTYANYSAQTGNSFGDLSISLHVYDPDPRRRFAFVDGRKVIEGDRLANNLRVAEITPAGVVFGHAGNRFLVPRD
ncbi:MAG: general secretion pathway protein GspB [Pseudomonadota bacterium]